MGGIPTAAASIQSSTVQIHYIFFQVCLEFVLFENVEKILDTFPNGLCSI